MKRNQGVYGAILLWPVAICLTIVSAAKAADVILTCPDAKLVERQKVRVLKYVDPEVPKASELELLGAIQPVFSEGRCVFQLKPGAYRFDVLWKSPDGTIVALSTGRQHISGDANLTLKAQNPQPLHLSYKGTTIPIERTQVRVPGTMDLVEIEGESPRVILSPEAPVKARIIAKKKGDLPVYAVIWADINGDNTRVEIADGWHSVCKFRSLCTGRTTDAEATFFAPEARRGMKAKGNDQVYEAFYGGENPNDLLVVPLDPNLTFLTNRRFVEMWYSYTNASGDRLSFTRRPVLLSPNQEIAWGGDLRLTAHARVMMTWIKGVRAIAWGADLINACGHRLNLPEDAVGLPGDTATFPNDSQIGWKVRLVRRDGAPLTLGRPGQTPKKNDLGERTDADNFQLEEYFTEQQYPEAYNRFPDKDAIKGVNADVSDLFDVAVSYKLNGKEVVRKIPCVPWVNYRSTHSEFEAPRGMNDVAFAQTDRIERTWFYGSAYPQKNRLDLITTRWTGCRWQGYSTGGAHSHVQLGTSTFRRRQSIYGADWGFSHEYLHSWGYDHGREHDDQIKRVDRCYRDHHIFLADHPEYEPEPVRIELNGKPITLAEIYDTAVIP